MPDKRCGNVNLSAFFDNTNHEVLLAKSARRIRDNKLLAMLKQLLKSFPTNPYS